MREEILTSWRDGLARQTLIDFVSHTCGEDGSATVPLEERVAVFDNDGTLWCEKPMPIQLGFILERLVAMVKENPELSTQQPWQAAIDRDHDWFGGAISGHYAGDDTDVQQLAAGILTAYAGIGVEDFEQSADRFLRTAQHPTLGRGYLECAYLPMVQLLDYLTTNGFSTYIASGGGRDFMRPISQDVSRIPRERVIGSSSTLVYTSDDHGGTITHNPEADYLDDGPEKPVGIWSRIGRRPLLAGGNSNGDVAMLQFTQHADKPNLRLLVRHDDPEREVTYTAGAERALSQAEDAGWTLVSMKDDWATIF